MRSPQLHISLLPFLKSFSSSPFYVPSPFLSYALTISFFCASDSLRFRVAAFLSADKLLTFRNVSLIIPLPSFKICIAHRSPLYLRSYSPSWFLWLRSLTICSLSPSPTDFHPFHSFTLASPSPSLSISHPKTSTLSGQFQFFI